VRGGPFSSSQCRRVLAFRHLPSRSCDRDDATATVARRRLSPYPAGQPIRRPAARQTLGTRRMISLARSLAVLSTDALVIDHHPPTLSTRAASGGCRLGGWSTRAAPGGRPRCPPSGAFNHLPDRAAHSGGALVPWRGLVVFSGSEPTSFRDPPAGQPTTNPTLLLWRIHPPVQLYGRLPPRPSHSQSEQSPLFMEPA
jgi:hypothetical protein